MMSRGNCVTSRGQSRISADASALAMCTMLTPGIRRKLVITPSLISSPYTQETRLFMRFIDFLIYL